MANGPCVVAIVLAAGASSRMAPRNKLLLLRDETGLTMVGRVVRACCGSRLVDQILLVTGHEAPDVGRAAQDAAAGRALRVIHADNYRLGMSASLRAGLTALPDHAEAALICLGDMPLVSSQIIDQVIGAYNASAGGLIVAPTSGGRRGNPVLWDRRFFAEMDSLRGDTGARALLKQHEAHLVEIEVGDECVLRDFDTPAALMAGFDRHGE